MTNVDRAFREWCALLGFSPAEPPQSSGYRLERCPDGRVQIELVRAEGSVERVAPAMTEAAFCDAVQLVSVSFRIKTVEVARTVARRMSKRGRNA